MIGWWIVIAQQTPEERDTSADRKAANIASWEASVNGIDWLEELCKTGKATKVFGGGYPSRYVAIARDIFPLISNGPPPHSGPAIFGDDYVMAGNWAGNIMIDRDKIAACSPEQTLTIEAWDQS